MNPFEWREYNGGFAIDFGDYSMKMAYIDNSGSHLIKLTSNSDYECEEYSLPTSICTRVSDGETIFGKLNFQENDWTIIDRLKEKLNRSDNLIDPNAVIDFMSQLIKYGIERAKNQMQNKINQVVIGQSATLLNRREYWKDPFKMAGVTVQRTIQEPVAACLNFQDKLRGRILVIDWGSELKISKIDEEESIFEVIECYGDNSTMGGHSITMDMVNLCAKNSNKQEFDSKILFYNCEKAKKLFSNSEVEMVEVSIGDDMVNITRKEMNQIYEEKLAQIPNILKKMKCTTMENVILCGGSLYSHYLNEKLRNLFEGSSLILSSPKPDEIVVRGIAKQAEYLQKPPLHNCLVSYVLPLSIGVDSDDGKMLVIIPRNTWYATSKDAELKRTVVNGGITLNFFEGMLENVIDNVWLGQISFENLGVENGSSVTIQIVMKVDDNCNIMVTAQINDIKKQVTMTKYDRTLSNVETENMINKSYLLGFNLPVIGKTSFTNFDVDVD